MTPAQLSAALAESLAGVLPEGMETEARAADLIIRVPAAPLLGMTLALGSLLADYNEEDRLEEGQVTHGCLSVLDDVQAVAVRLLGRAWPAEADLQTPGARIVDDRVVLWFGREDAPVLMLRPVRLA